MGVEPQIYHGSEGFRRWFDGFNEVMELRVEGHDFIAVGDRVVATHTLYARGRETGIETEQFTVQVWRLSDGKAKRLEVFATYEALEAAQRPDGGQRLRLRQLGQARLPHRSISSSLRADGR